MSENKEKIETVDVDDVEEDDDDVDGGNLAHEVLQRPDILAYLQDQMLAKDYIRSLPLPVKRRIKALKKLQFESIQIEAQFYEEVHKLECLYHSKYFPLYDKRYEIVNGTYEPKDEECDWPSDIEDEENELSKEVKEKAKIQEVTADEKKTEDEDKVGIPGFWLTVFHNVGMLSEMIQVYDEPILKHLIDVRVIILEKEPMGFVLEFHFSKNPYFNNVLLTKEYVMKCEPDENDPFSFEGPEIYKSVGCKIDWCKDKNVTVKTVRKKQKHKSKGQCRTVVKTEPNDSFFNFFNPPEVPEDPNADIDDETQALLSSDFEIGHYIRERVIPRAVLYFTGEAMDDDMDEEELEEEEDDEEEAEEEEEESDENEEHPPKPIRKANKTGNNGKEEPVECKQQ